MPQIELSKSEIENLIDFFDFEFIPYIKYDVELDNMKYLTSMCDVYKKLETALDEVRNKDRIEVRKCLNT
jgi:hypothetical protein